MICSPKGDSSYEQSDLGPSCEVERDFLPSSSRRTRVMTVPLQGKFWPYFKTQHCKEVPAPLSILCFWKRMVEKRWSTILNEHWALLFLDLDAMFFRARGGWARSSICLHIFLLPISKYRDFGASFSIGVGVKTDISKYFPVITWVFTSVLAPWNSTEAISPLTKKICTSHEVTSIQDQLLTAHFPFLLWTLRLLLAQQLNTEPWLLFLQLSWAREMQEKLDCTENSEKCLPVHSIFPG